MTATEVETDGAIFRLHPYIGGETNVAEAVLIEPNEPSVDDRPGWSTWREIPAVVLYPAHLRRTIAIAAIVGTVLFTINQLDVVLAGGLTARVAVKIGLTYVVPFGVSNYGLLVGRRVTR